MTIASTAEDFTPDFAKHLARSRALHYPKDKFYGSRGSAKSGFLIITRAEAAQANVTPQSIPTQSSPLKFFGGKNNSILGGACGYVNTYPKRRNVIGIGNRASPQQDQ